jgi:hypothetical protein
LDNFDANDIRTYEQVYFEHMPASQPDKTNQKVFLYLCGEWNCDVPVHGLDSFEFQEAAKYDAIIYILSHRFYGYSQPFDDWSLENLKYLSAKQAIEDAYNFMLAKNHELGFYQADWIVVGGSYPGALSAFFKSRHNDAAVMSWSSSGVINAIGDYSMFDYNAYDAMRKDSNMDCVF